MIMPHGLNMNDIDKLSKVARNDNFPKRLIIFGIPEDWTTGM
jgi:hypothetical protein